MRWKRQKEKGLVERRLGLKHILQKNWHNNCKEEILSTGGAVMEERGFTGKVESVEEAEDKEEDEKEGEEVANTKEERRSGCK